ncbi:unnamed protein product [Musa acuminata subsp. malaccensis]|uniref:(wild Malaysian banana) hypothetical protein n=1 Tax=Musa acuminata subsp. malaccensis TaxID=214687 RepID=A0A804KY60_MUSAM|nr:unnamed protein product [Musa acuminata subsp. malaccensis]
MVCLHQLNYSASLPTRKTILSEAPSRFQAMPAREFDSWNHEFCSHTFL